MIGEQKRTNVSRETLPPLRRTSVANEKDKTTGQDRNAEELC